MEVEDGMSEFMLLADAASVDEAQAATWDRPRVLKLRAAPVYEDEVDGSGDEQPPAEVTPGAEINIAFGRAPRTAAAVTIDHDRASASPVSTHYAEVIDECLECLAMLARHRDERPLRGRPEIEARMLAQVDAIVEAGATVGDVAEYWSQEVEDDPWAAWATTFTLGCLDGRESLVALRDLCEGLSGELRPAVTLVAEALLAAPHPGRAALGRDLRRSSAPLARAIGIELLSRLGELGPEVAMAALEDARVAVQVAGIRAVARKEATDAVLSRLVSWLNGTDPDVACEAARALTLFGRDDALADLRRGGQLVRVLDEDALELLVLRGSLDDIAIMQRLVNDMPMSAELLSAVARFGHPAVWAYLIHALTKAEFVDAAHDALVTLFGPAVVGTHTTDPTAWREALAAADLQRGVRLRRGQPWSPEVVLAECASGGLSRREVELRSDELRARTGTWPGVDLAMWGTSVNPRGLDAE